MLKTSENIETLIQPRKGGVGIGCDNRAGRDNSKLDKSEIGDNKVYDEVDDEVGKKDWNPTKSKNLSKFKKTELGFLIFGARMTFNKLRKAFIKASILYHVNSKHHI